MLGLQNRKEKKTEMSHFQVFFLITVQQYKPCLNYNNSLNYPLDSYVKLMLWCCKTCRISNYAFFKARMFASLLTAITRIDKMYHLFEIPRSIAFNPTILN